MAGSVTNRRQRPSAASWRATSAGMGWPSRSPGASERRRSASRLMVTVIGIVDGPAAAAAAAGTGCAGCRVWRFLPGRSGWAGRGGGGVGGRGSRRAQSCRASKRRAPSSRVSSGARCRARLSMAALIWATVSMGPVALTPRGAVDRVGVEGDVAVLLGLVGFLLQKVGVEFRDRFGDPFREAHGSGWDGGGVDVPGLVVGQGAGWRVRCLRRAAAAAPRPRAASGWSAAGTAPSRPDRPGRTRSWRCSPVAAASS